MVTYGMARGPPRGVGTRLADGAWGCRGPSHLELGAAGALDVMTKFMINDIIPGVITMFTKI